MTAAIEGPFEARKFSAVAIHGDPAVLEPLIWHIANIIEPAGFGAHCQQRWARMVDSPRMHLGSVPSDVNVVERLNDLAAKAAHLDESPNAWDSCFYDGIARNAGATAFLRQRLEEQLEAANQMYDNGVNSQRESIHGTVAMMRGIRQVGLTLFREDT